jgi:hypothetical protein
MWKHLTFQDSYIPSGKEYKHRNALFSSKARTMSLGDFDLLPDYLIMKIIRRLAPWDIIKCSALSRFFFALSSREGNCHISIYFSSPKRDVERNLSPTTRRVFCIFRELEKSCVASERKQNYSTTSECFL